MTWSTRELAELAGTTVKAIRHYHRIGLFDEPERADNGYKLYTVRDLVRLLRIKRLVDLGVPLAQIAAMNGTGSTGDTGDQPIEALRIIDASIEATIERLKLVRVELGMILENRAITDLPIGFTGAAADLSEADRSLLLIYSRIFTDTAMDDLRTMVIESADNPINAELDALIEGADEATRQDLAERFVPYLKRLTVTYPWLAELGSASPRGAEFAGNVIYEAVTDLYNEAQLDVLMRSALLAYPKPA